VGIEPTTFGLKDQNHTQPLQSATVNYREISNDAQAELVCSGLVVCVYPHKSRTVGPALESHNSEYLAPTPEAQNANYWSADDERTIKTVQQAELVPRAEAIRRMQRRKKLSPLATVLASLKREAVLTVERLCQNPRCTKGEDGGPGSMAHLRADARYCDAICKKAVQRSSKRRNRASNRQCLCGSKRGQSGSLEPPPYQHEGGAQIGCNRHLKSIRQTETIGSVGLELQATEKEWVDRGLVLDKTNRIRMSSKTR
jgi:hypothetical protein